jgi:hypothetical protein
VKKKSKLKAYHAFIENAEVGTLVHGETPGKAKYRFLRCEPSGWLERSDYEFIRLRRLPACDDKPFTYETATSAGFVYYDENGEELDEKYFTNDCDCEICHPKKAVGGYITPGLFEIQSPCISQSGVINA